MLVVGFVQGGGLGCVRLRVRVRLYVQDASQVAGKETKAIRSTARYK